MNIETAIAHLEAFLNGGDEGGDVSLDEATEALDAIRAYVRSSVHITSHASKAQTTFSFEAFVVTQEEPDFAVAEAEMYIAKKDDDTAQPDPTSADGGGI